MFEAMAPLFAASVGYPLLVSALVAVGLFALLTVAILMRFGALWFQAYMCGADVSVMSLIGMSFRQVNPGLIVTAKIMGRQAGLNIDRDQGMSTARLEAHFLAGGDVMHVLRAIIAAHRAGIDLDFDRAAAIDLAGRDVLDAVRTSVSPKVIDCPDPQRSGKTTLSAVAKNGVELLHPRAGDRPHESGSVDRRSDRGNDHCSRWPGNRYRHRIRPNTHGSVGNARPHFQERVGTGSGCEHGISKSSRSISRILMSEKTSELVCRATRPKRTRGWPGRVPRCVARKRSPASRK